MLIEGLPLQDVIELIEQQKYMNRIVRAMSHRTTSVIRNITNVENFTFHLTFLSSVDLLEVNCNCNFCLLSLREIEKHFFSQKILFSP